MTERTAVNPWAWSLAFGFNQGELVEGATRVLFCAGQTSVDGNGVPQHPGNMAAQAAQAMDNLDAVLGKAKMTLANLVRLNFYTTDVDDYLTNGAAVTGARLGGAGVAPAGTLLGVTRLAFPDLLLEIEATAVA
jgi:enamine deaminase RidA (YjgF/YER057c/UK114 family)